MKRLRGSQGSRAPSGAFTSSVRSVYELCQERSTFTRFTVHEVHRSRGSPFTRFTVHEVHRSHGTFTSSVRSIYELRQEPMKHPFDMFTPLHSNVSSWVSSRIRPNSTYSNTFKFPLIQYLIRLEPSSNPARNTNVHTVPRSQPLS